MRKYTKENGKLPITDFEPGDVVVYEGKGQKNIIIVDDIYEARHGDIFYKTALVKADGELPYLMHFSEVDYRNWFNGDTLRDATAEEVKELLDWLLPFVPEELMVDSYNCRKKAMEFQEKIRTKEKTEEPEPTTPQIDISELEKYRVRVGGSLTKGSQSAKSELEEMKNERDEWHRKYEELENDDIVKKIVEETKHFFKHDRNKADVIRQIMIKVGRPDADKELDDWIEGRETSKKTIGQLVVEQNNYDVAPALTGVVNDVNMPKLPNNNELKNDD